MNRSLDILAFPFPSSDHEQSNVDAHVAPTKCLRNPPDAPDPLVAHVQNSDNVQQSATIRVSKCQLLLYSQPFGLGLLVELLTRGVAAAILAGARDFCL